MASKAAGFVALLTVVFVAFPGSHEVWQPVFWILSALTMTVGNAMALRQSNVVRMLAYSSVAQGGFILMPLAVAGTNDAAQPALRAVVTYLLLYAATNLGVFGVIMAAAYLAPNATVLLFFVIPMGPRTCIGTTDTRVGSADVRVEADARGEGEPPLADPAEVDRARDPAIGERQRVLRALDDTRPRDQDERMAATAVGAITDAPIAQRVRGAK